MPEAAPRETHLLSYRPAHPPAGEAWRPWAIALSFPPVLFFVLIPFVVWSDWIRGLGLAPIALLWVLALATSIVAIAEYQPVRAKPAHLVVCLAISWCFLGPVLACAAFLLVAVAV